MDLRTKIVLVQFGQTHKLAKWYTDAATEMREGKVSNWAQSQIHNHTWDSEGWAKADIHSLQVFVLLGKQ